MIQPRPLRETAIVRSPEYWCDPAVSTQSTSSVAVSKAWFLSSIWLVRCEKRCDMAR